MRNAHQRHVPWRLWRWVISVIIVVISVTGCTSTSVPSQSTPTSKKKIQIAVLGGYEDFDESIRSWYTQSFEMRFPNIKVDVVGALAATAIEAAEGPLDTFDAMKRLLQGENPPDVVFIDDSTTLSRYIEEQLLAPMDTYMLQDQMDQDQFIPTVIDVLRESAPDGLLYGMTPFFSAYALFYNRALFDRFGVPYPEDEMTWQQIFQLSEQFVRTPRRSPVFGFAFDVRNQTDLLSDAQVYTQAKKMKFYDDRAEQMLVQSPQWEQVFSELIAWKKRQPAYAGDQDLFQAGQLAMVLGSFQYAEQLVQRQQSLPTSTKETPLQWDVVTVPIHKTEPVGFEMISGGIWAINAKAQNPSDAWEFIKFIHSPEWIRIKSKQAMGIPVLQQFAKPREGMEYRIEAFYSLPFVLPERSFALEQKYPSLSEAIVIGQPQLELVMQGEKSLKEALRRWKRDGDQRLKAIRQKAK